MMFADIPLDLESEILSRVPATSLKELQTMIVTEQNTLFHSINLRGIQNSFDPSIGVEGKLNRLKDSEQVKIRDIIFHCDGLLLCSTKDNNLVVWNPCTGQTRSIHFDYTRMFYSYVLGYVNNNNNNKSCDRYKILAFDFLFCSQKSTLAKFEIYEFNSDSWRILDDVSPNCFIISEGVTLKGNAYWFDSDKEGKSILKFDFTTERFGRLSLPFQNDDDDQNVVLSVVREEKLALLQGMFDTDSLKIDEDKDLSWSNFLVVDFGKVMLTRATLSFMSFLVDEENKMVVCSDIEVGTETRTRIYFAKEGLQVHQEIAQKPTGCWPFLVSYVPSLVQIQ